jgi:drug/metabolite transporter (DMT)-like permease
MAGHERPRNNTTAERGQRVEVTRASEKEVGAGAPSAWLPFLLVCIAPILWGFSGVLVRWAGLPGKEYIIIFYRSVIAFAFTFAVVLVTRSKRMFRPGSGIVLLTGSGLVTAAYTICAFKAYDLVAIGTATFIIYLAPVFVALLAPLFLREKLEPSTILCLAIALAGTGLLSWSQSEVSPHSRTEGTILALAAAALWAILMLIWKKLRDTHSPLTIGLWTHGVCALVYAPFAIPATGDVTGKGWASIAVFGVVVIGVAGLIYLYALKRVKAQDAALLSYIEPVSAMAYGLLLLGEAPHWQNFLGAALIVAAGVLLLVLRRPGEEVGEVFDAAER